MRPGEAVGDAGYLRGRQDCLEEGELGAARVAVALGDREHGAIVLCNKEGTVRLLLEIGEVAVLVEDLGDNFDGFGEGKSCGAGAGAFTQPASTIAVSSSARKILNTCATPTAPAAARPQT